jgi:hypothetical protein
VPTLAELREQAGFPRYLPVPEAIIPEMLGAGQLMGPSCLRCGEITQDSVEVITECERAPLKTKEEDGLIAFDVVPIYFGKKTSAGQDLFVPTPLRLCGQCQGRIRGSTGSSLFLVLAALCAIAAVVYWCFAVPPLGVILSACFLAALVALKLLQVGGLYIFPVVPASKLIVLVVPVLLAFYPPWGTFGTAFLVACLSICFCRYLEGERKRNYLKTLMREITPYAQLLEKFPDAHIRLKGRNVKDILGLF